MDEKEMEIKTAEFQLQATERDIENKNRELDDFKYRIVLADKRIEAIEKEKVIFKKIAELMLNNYGRVEGKVEHLWELKPEYWELMKEKQVLDNEQKFMTFETEIRQLKRQKISAEEQIDGIEQALVLDKDTLETQKKQIEELKKGE